MNARSHSRLQSLEQESGSLPEEIWSQFRAVLKPELKAMIEQALEKELTEHVAARSLERTAERRGYRNGHYQRRLLTRHGEIPDVCDRVLSTLLVIAIVLPLFALLLLGSAKL